MLTQFYKIFTDQEREIIKKAEHFAGNKHPTWFPLFLQDGDLESIDYWLNQAVSQINEAGGQEWLQMQKPNLLDLIDANNASASMAEIRVYGGLLESGFEVAPINTMSNFPTPDFNIDTLSGSVEIEVASKHQCKAEDMRQQDIYKAMNTEEVEFPENVEHYVRSNENTTVKMVISELNPSGKPNPEKSDDSAQTNLISHICSLKGDEKQISGGSPAMLVVDLTAFGGREVASLSFSNLSQAFPLICGNYGLTSGALWYAMYGWICAPVFVEREYRRILMRHEGRFRLSGDKKSKFSAVLFLLPKNVVLFENPWSEHKLPDEVRFGLCRYPGFNLAYSICDWQIGHVEKQVELQRQMICVLEQRLDEMQTFWRIQS